MGQYHLVPEARAQRIQSARQLFFERGHTPDNFLDEALVRSWERCQRLGMDPSDGFVTGNIIDRSCLKVEWERNRLLMDHAQSIMEQVFEQIQNSGSMVILADAQGLLLHSVGDPEFAGQAGRVSLRLGACWDEQERGTNAIGTALVEERFVEVYGAEHFLEHNGFLTCCAAPLTDSQGRVIGALDISGDFRNYQYHTRGLVRMTAQVVDKRVFESEQHDRILVCFHERSEYLGGLGEGTLAVNADNAIVAINRAGLQLLGLRRHEVVGRDFSVLFETQLGHLVDESRRDPRQRSLLVDREGRVFRANVRGTLPAMSHLGRVLVDVSASRPVRGRQTRPSVDPAAITLESLGTGDPRLQLALDRVKRVLGRDIPILVQGESGAGKQMFAKAFHNSGNRVDKPFVALNCAAIPDNLVESELFGYLGGAFTGARKEGAPGKIQQAHGGTLFLDEIGDMPLNLQARLLRVLQERCVTPLGSSKAIPVDISLICATHRNLKEEVKAGNFREDLYYRLNGLSVTLPALRERTDLDALVAKIIQVESPERNVTLDADVLELFKHYAWPGNIRQMNNVLRVAIALLDEAETTITRYHLPEEILEQELPFAGQSVPPVVMMNEPAPTQSASPATVLGSLGGSLEEIEKASIFQALEEVGGNVSAAARRLGISRNTLYRKIGRL